MSDSLTVQIDRLLLLREVAPRIRLSVGHSQYLLAHDRFPIKYVGTRPYRFSPRDVQAYIDHGTVTNPVLLEQQRSKPRRYFGKARARLQRPA